MSDALLGFGASDAPRRLDRFDARLRVAAAVAVVAAILAVRSPLLLAGLVPVMLALAFASGVGLREIGGRLAHLEGFLVVLVMVLPLTVPGPEAIALGPLSLSQPGVERAVGVLLRVNLAAMAIQTLLAGLEPVRFGHALAGLGLPAKLVHLLLFSARWVALIRAEAVRLDEALRTRAFRPATSFHTLRTVGHFAGQLLVRAFERAERVDEAMRCRAFAGRFALVAEARATWHDAVLAAGTLLGIALVILVDRSL